MSEALLLTITLKCIFATKSSQLSYLKDMYLFIVCIVNMQELM